MKQVKLILSICLAFVCTTSFAQLAEAYKKAAEQGDANAQYNLGVCYKRGEGGVDQDYNKAVYWYRKAAEQGLAEAQHNLGVCYINGEGVPKVIEKAVFWWEKAAAQGYANSQYNLGYCYEFGEGVDVDYNKAVYWYKKAAEQGDKDAQLALNDFVASSYHNGHEYVDLGLSVKWATCNVGATTPEGYGDYFAWGETSPKSEYTWGNLKFCKDEKGKSFSKYNQTERGTKDSRTVLELSDDAAHANWGGSWRMPTIAEFRELEDKCTWTSATVNGTIGYNVVSKLNGNSIFLPAAGVRINTSRYSGGSYWSSSLCEFRYYDHGSNYAQTLGCELFSSHHSDMIGHGTYYNYRREGCSVRPVFD